MNELFGPMETGSIRGSIFNMTILSLGFGCLSLPKYVGKTSLALSVVMVVVIGLLIWRVDIISNNYIHINWRNHLQFILL